MTPESFNGAGEFAVSAPLPRTDAIGTHEGFEEDPKAHAMYVGHRSSKSAPNAVTHQIVHSLGEVAGFISYRTTEEVDDDECRLFVGVEYVFIRAHFRGNGLSHLLLRPVVQQVSVQVEGLVNRPRKCRILSASTVESKGGARTLRALEGQLAQLAASNGVELVGWYVSHP